MTSRQERKIASKAAVDVVDLSNEESNVEEDERNILESRDVQLAIQLSLQGTEKKVQWEPANAMGALRYRLKRRLNAAASSSTGRPAKKVCVARVSPEKTGTAPLKSHHPRPTVSNWGRQYEWIKVAANISRGRPAKKVCVARVSPEKTGKTQDHRPAVSNWENQYEWISMNADIPPDVKSLGLKMIADRFGATPAPHDGPHCKVEKVLSGSLAERMGFQVGDWFCSPREVGSLPFLVPFACALEQGKLSKSFSCSVLRSKKCPSLRTADLASKTLTTEDADFSVCESPPSEEPAWSPQGAPNSPKAREVVVHRESSEQPGSSITGPPNQPLSIADEAQFVLQPQSAEEMAQIPQDAPATLDVAVPLEASEEPFPGPVLRDSSRDIVPLYDDQLAVVSLDSQAAHGRHRILLRLMKLFLLGTALGYASLEGFCQYQLSIRPHYLFPDSIPMTNCSDDASGALLD